MRPDIPRKIELEQADKKARGLAKGNACEIVRKDSRDTMPKGSKSTRAQHMVENVCTLALLCRGANGTPCTTRLTMQY